MAESYKDMWKRVRGMYGWKLFELLTILALARIFVPEDFGYAFYVIMLTSATQMFFVIEGKKDHSAYSGLMGLSIILGLLGAAAMFFISYVSPGVHKTYMLRFFGLSFMLSMFCAAPVSYFSGENKKEKVYTASLIGQVSMLLVATGLYFLNFGYIAILYGYLLYWVVNFAMLWRGMIKVAPSFGLSTLKELKPAGHILDALIRYGILVIAPFFFGIVNFSFLYVAFYIGFFLYENVTLFLTHLLLPLFKSHLENQELFNLNLLRILEYISFVVMPFTIIPLLLSKSLLSFIFTGAWNIYDLAFIMVIAGTVKAILEASAIILLAKEKIRVINRIKTFEIILLAVISLFLGMKLGLFGLAFAVLASSIVSSLLLMAVSLKVLKLNIVTVSKDYFYIIFSGILTCLLLGVLKEWLSAEGALIVGILWLLGVALFTISIFLINRDFLKRFVRFVFSIVGEEK